jgi:hypothetical protein
VLSPISWIIGLSICIGLGLGFGFGLGKGAFCAKIKVDGITKRNKII